MLELLLLLLFRLLGSFIRRIKTVLSSVFFESMARGSNICGILSLFSSPDRPMPVLVLVCVCDARFRENDNLIIHSDACNRDALYYLTYSSFYCHFFSPVAQRMVFFLLFSLFLLLCASLILHLFSVFSL